MPPIPIPANEADRLATLRRLEILDTLPEQAYDDITLLAATIAEVPVSLISFVDQSRQWFKSSLGLDISETPRDVAFCAHAIMEPTELLVVPDASKDLRFADNPLVTDDPDIRFYAGAPLVTNDGHALGTLCIIDREPRSLVGRQLDALRALSRQVIAQLELRRAVADLEDGAARQARYEEQLESYQRELEVANLRLEAESRTDALTGLMNRRAFERSIAYEVERSRRYRIPLSLLMLDVDHFKAYNDALGHQAGDLALAKLAHVMAATARTTDIPTRYGGEEFAIILPQTQEDEALVVAERCRLAVHEAGWPPPHVTVSVGIATMSGDMDVKQLVGAADEALYEAKQRGRDRCLAAPAMRTRSGAVATTVV